MCIRDRRNIKGNLPHLFPAFGTPYSHFRVGFLGVCVDFPVYILYIIIIILGNFVIKDKNKEVAHNIE